MNSAKSKIDIINCMYDQLKELKIKNEKGAFDNADGVFRTYEGEKYRRSSERLMIVGKATAGWDDENENEAKEFVMQCVVRGAYTSSFWRFIHDLLCKVHPEIISKAPSNRKGREEVFKRVVWSNIMKIGINGGNPYGNALKDQREVCTKLLRLEIEHLKPTKLVFVTGNEYWEDVEQAIEYKEGQKKIGPGIWKLKHRLQLEKSSMLFCTRHPQGWAKDDMREAIRKIASQ